MSAPMWLKHQEGIFQDEELHININSNSSVLLGSIVYEPFGIVYFFILKTYPPFHVFYQILTTW